MQAAGVDTGEVLVSPDVATGQGIGIIAENGDNILITGESSSEKLTWEEVQAAMLRRRGAGYFITGLEVRMPLVLRAIQLARPAARCGRLFRKRGGSPAAFGPARRRNRQHL